MINSLLSPSITRLYIPRPRRPRIRRSSRWQSRTVLVSVLALVGCLDNDVTDPLGIEGPPSALDAAPAGASATSALLAIADVKRDSYTARELKEGGYTAQELKEAGYLAGELKESGYTAGDLKEAGYMIKELREAGFTAEEMREGGYTAEEIHGIYPAEEIH